MQSTIRKNPLFQQWTITIHYINENEKTNDRSNKETITFTIYVTTYNSKNEITYECYKLLAEVERRSIENREHTMSYNGLLPNNGLLVRKYLSQILPSSGIIKNYVNGSLDIFSYNSRY